MGRKQVPLKLRTVPIALSIPLHALVTIEKYCIAADMTKGAFLKGYIMKLVDQLEREDTRLTSEEEQLLRARVRKILRSNRLEGYIKADPSELHT